MPDPIPNPHLELCDGFPSHPPRSYPYPPAAPERLQIPDTSTPSPRRLVILDGSTGDERTMNSLNFVSSRVSPSSSPGPSRSNSLGSMGITVTSEEEEQQKEASNARLDEKTSISADPDRHQPAGAPADENTPLLSGSNPKDSGIRQSPWHLVPRRIFSAVIGSLRWVLSTLAAPGVYLIACLYDEHGHFAPWLQFKRLFGIYHADPRKMAAAMQEKAALEDSANSTRGETINIGRGNAMATRPIPSSGSSTSGLSSESESEMDRESSKRNSRSKSLQSSEEISPSRRSIRIKLHNEETLRQRKQKKGQSASSRRGASGNQQQKDISAHLKSPTSPVGALTKYPKTPAPPRPLIPRRQPSYINIEADAQTPQKTLILDLDETLIHSMSKGGRMSTGHMVEVKLNTTYVGVGGQASIGPQHPILYYVHKRPHCDDFLRRVSAGPCLLLGRGKSMRGGY